MSTATLQTNHGPVEVEFFDEDAPKTVENFRKLAADGFYDNLGFHRVIRDFMIQGGCPLGTGTGDAGYKIPAEFNATPHEAGVISMARTNDPNSAGSQFFICLDRHGHLDRYYTAFGKVADEDSMATVRAIGSVATRGDRPVQPVTIDTVTVTSRPR